MSLHSKWVEGNLAYYDGADSAIGGKAVQFGSVKSSALLHGGGTSAAPLTASTASNFLGYWVRSSAATGDVRGLYLRTYISGGAGGEAGRFWATGEAAASAATGTINGVHATGSLLGASANLATSGVLNGLRATVSADAQTRTIPGKVSAVQLCSDFATGNTLPTGNSFIRCTDDGAVRLANLMQIPVAANGTLLAAHDTQGMTHSIRIIAEDGTPYYIMCASAATNRS